MVEGADLWDSVGLRQYQVVDCLVIEHRGRFGVDVEIVSPVSGVSAFIDFILLAESGVQVTPKDFPPVGSTIEAVTIDFMPFTNELRLDARPSAVASRKPGGA